MTNLKNNEVNNPTRIASADHKFEGKCCTLQRALPQFWPYRSNPSSNFSSYGLSLKRKIKQLGPFLYFQNWLRQTFLMRSWTVKRMNKGCFRNDVCLWGSQNSSSTRCKSDTPCNICMWEVYMYRLYRCCLLPWKVSRIHGILNAKRVVKLFVQHSIMNLLWSFYRHMFLNSLCTWKGMTSCARAHCQTLKNWRLVDWIDLLTP